MLEIDLQEVSDKSWQVFIQIRIIDSLPKIYLELTEDFPKIVDIFKVIFFFDSHKRWVLDGTSSLFQKRF